MKWQRVSSATTVKMRRNLHCIYVGTLSLLSNLSFTCLIPMMIVHSILICLVLGRITMRHYGRTCQPLTRNNPLYPLPPTKIGRNLQWIYAGFCDSIVWFLCSWVFDSNFFRIVFSQLLQEPLEVLLSSFLLWWTIFFRLETLGQKDCGMGSSQGSEVRCVWWPPCTRIWWLWVNFKWVNFPSPLMFGVSLWRV